MVKNLETKKQIRTRALEERRALTSEARDRYSRTICRLVVEHPLFQSAREIYCYASFREEVKTESLIEEAWKAGKRVAVPRVEEEGKMDFYYIDSLEELSCGYQGIPEPAKDVSKAALPEAAGTLIILPGAAFDKSGNRIGYGKGFYDRYLNAHPCCRRMGLAYQIQCVESIPAKPHDACVEAVITEKGNYMACRMDYQKTLCSC